MFISNSKELTLGQVGISSIDRVQSDGSTVNISNTAQLIGLTKQTDGAHIVIQTTDGDIQINEALTASATGNIRIAADAGNVVVNKSISLEQGHITILANGNYKNLIQNANITTDGGSNDIKAGGIIMAENNLASSNNGDIRYEATTENITFSQIDAGNGSLALIASAGSIKAVSEMTLNNINAGTLGLVAAKEIDITEINVPVLSVQMSGEQDLIINHMNENGLTIDAVNSHINRIQANGLTPELTNDITLADLSLENNGSITLISQGDIIINDGNADHMGINAKSGDILLESGGSISIQSGIHSGVGNISLIAQSTFTQGSENNTDADIITNGTIDIIAGDSLTAYSGNIIYSENSNINMTAGGNLSLAQINAGTATLSLKANNITDSGTDELNLIAANLNIETTNGGFGESQNKVEISIDSLSAKIKHGGLYINETDGISIDTLSENLGNGNSKSSIESEDDIILLVEQGDLVINSIRSGGNVELTAMAGSIIDNADDDIVDIQAGTGNLITITASGSIENIDLADEAKVKISSMTSGNVQIQGLGAITLEDVNAADGSININANGNINAINIISNDNGDDDSHDISLKNTNGSIAIGTITSDNNVIIESAGSITSTNAIISGNDAILLATTGIGTDTNMLNLNFNRLDAVNSTSGNINIINAKELILTDLNNDSQSIDNIGGGTIKAQGTLNITSAIQQRNDFNLIAGDTSNQGDNLIISAPIINTIASTIHLQAGDHIQIESVAINSNGGTISLLADNEGNNFEDNDRGSITNNGVVTASNLNINSYNTVSFTGNVDVLSATIVNGDFTYVGTNSVAIDQVFAGGKVSITSQSGSITDHADDADIDITSGIGSVSLQAEKNIQGFENGDEYLELAQGTSLFAQSQGSGDIQLSGLGSLNLENVTTQDGSINIVSKGDMNAGIINSNQIALNTEGSITCTSSTPITTNKAIISAATGIGTADNYFALDASYLDIKNIQSGGMYIISSKALTLTDLNEDGQAVQNVGNGIIESAHSLNITDAVNLDANEFTLKAGDSELIGDKLSITSNISQTNAEMLYLQAGDDIILSGSMISTGDGAISFIADHEGDGIDTDRGCIIQNGGGLTASTLSFNAYDNINFSSKNNNADTLTATVSNGYFSYTDADSIQIDKITADQAISITAISGSISDYQDDAESDIISGAKNVSLIAANDINGLELASGTTLTAKSQQAGSINIRGLGDINLNNVETVDGSVDIVADGQINAFIVTSADTNDDNSHNISLTNTNGNIEVGTISADHIVKLTAKGAIIAAAGNITGFGAILSASGGIGNIDNKFNMNVSQLDLINKKSGDIYIKNSKDMTLIDLNNDKKAVNNFGGGIIESLHSLTISNDIQQSADFSLIAADNLTLSANIQHNTGGRMTLQSSDDILHKAGKIVSGSGTIVFIADHDNSGKGGILQSGGELRSSNIYVNASETVSLTNGKNDFDIIQASVSTGHFLYTDTNDISIDKITAGGAVSITAKSEFIADYSDDMEIDISSGSGQINLTAQGRIAGLEEGDAYLELAPGSNLSASSQKMGNILLRSFGDLTLTNVVTADGEIQINTTGKIKALNMISGDLGDNNSFDITLNSGDSIEAGKIKADNHVVLNTPAKITGNESIMISGLAAIINAQEGIGTDDMQLYMDVKQLDAINSTSGGIYINNASDLSLIDLNNDQKAIENIAGGRIESQHALNIDSNIDQGADFTLSAGDSENIKDQLTISANITHLAGGTITLQAGDDIFHNSGIISTANGQINFIAGHEGVSIDSDQGGISQNNGQIIASLAQFQAEDNVSYASENIDIISANVGTGEFSFTTDTIVIKSINAGNINVTADGIITAIQATASENMTLQSTSDKILVGNLKAGNDLTLNALESSIVDLNENAIQNIQAGGLISLTSATDLSILNLADDSNLKLAITDGNINIKSLGALTLQDIQTANGIVDIKAAGSITAINVNAPDHINIHSTEGDILIGSIQSADAVTIIAENGSIIDATDDNIVDISALEKITLIASANIGNNTFLEVLTSEAGIEARSTHEGSINIQSTGFLNLQSIETTDGNIAIRSDSNILALNITTGDRDNDESTTLSISSKETIETGIIKADDILHISADKIIKSFGTITAKDAILTASNGIGTSSTALSLEVNRLDMTNQVSGDIYIHNQGDLILADLTEQGKSVQVNLEQGKSVDNIGGGLIEASASLSISGVVYQSKDFSLIANSGSINISNDIKHRTAGTINLIAEDSITQQSGTISSNFLILESSNGIGTDTAALTTAVVSLDAVNRYSGDINIKNTGDLILTDLNDDAKAINNIGGGNIASTGKLTISDDIRQSKDFSLISENDQLNINANVIHTGSGKITFDSGADIIQESGVIVSYNGEVNFHAMANINQISGELKAAHGNFTADQFNFTAGSNDIDSLSAQATTIDYIDIDDLMINTVFAKANVNLKADSIFDHADDQLADITSEYGIINLTANTNISGNDETNYLDIGHNSHVNAISNGDIRLNGTGDIILETITSAGNITIHAEDQITANNMSANNITIISKTGSISAGAIYAENLLTLTAADNITDTAGTITAIKTILNSTNGIGTAENSLTLADNSTVTAQSNGEINLSGEGSLTLQAITTTQGAINIIAQGNIIANNISTVDEDDASDNSININSLNGEISIDTINAKNNVTIYANGEITIGTISTNDDVTIYAGNGDLTVQNITSEKSINLTSISGAIQKAQGSSSINGDHLTVNAKTGIDLITNISKIDALLIGPGDIVIQEFNNIVLKTLTTFAGSITVNSGGSLEAVDVRSVDGNVTINSHGELIATKVSASKRNDINTHDVSLSTKGGNMIIDMIVADNAITINVIDGELLDNNDPEVDIQAKSFS
ncbi:hypothetical protein MHK_006526, partial [Candidatus Magnetomorum sp. HK-1]